MFSAVILIFLSAILASYLYIRKRFRFWAENGIPFEPPSFPFGNLKIIGQKKQISVELGSLYSKGKQSNSPFYGLYFFTKPVIMATDLNFIRTVLIKDFGVFQDRGFHYNEKDDPLSANLFNLEPKRWKALRSKLTPTFTSGKMRSMLPTIISVAETFVKLLSEVTQTSTEIEIRELLARFTTDVIGTCAFGIECNSLKDPNGTFRQKCRKVTETPRNTALQRIIITSFPNLAKKLRLRSHHKDIDEFFTSVVKETIALRETNNIHRNDFMDLLIQLKNEGTLKDEKEPKVGHLTINEIVAQAFVFFFAGFDTSSTALTYTLYELAQEKYSHIQEKVHREIDDVLKKHNGQLTYEALSEMCYVEQVINEALRKYPPIGILSRIAAVDYRYNDMKFKMKKGTRVIIPVYGIHHDPEIYKNPEEFMPERFETEEVKKRPPCSFIAFGDGPRNCIGLRFGMLQAKIGLISLLKNYCVSTCNRTDPMPLQFHGKKFVLSPRGEIWLKIKAR